MLILGRRVGQEIKISDDITITVLSINESGNVRLGVTAPKDIPVMRTELTEGHDLKIHTDDESDERNGRPERNREEADNPGSKRLEVESND